MRKRNELEEDNDITEEDTNLFKDGESSSALEISERKALSVEDMLRESGGFGYWHLYSFILCVLNGSISSMLIYTMAFLEKMPAMIWTNQDGSEFHCTTTDICKEGIRDESIKFKIDYDDENTINNWVTQMDLYWLNRFQMGLFGSMYFIGFVLSGFLLMLSDVYGRK